MFEDKVIIPKYFNVLDSETIHLYNVLIKGIVLIITKCS